jgi:hypothetical protein
MKRWTRLYLGILFLSSCTLVFATGSFTASYTEASDTTIYNASTFGITSSGFPVACPVGTIVVRNSGNDAGTLYGLRLQRSGNFGGGAEFSLASTKTVGWMTEFGAQLVAKVTSGGTTTVQKMNHGALDPFRPEVFYFTSFPVTIELYLGIRNIKNENQVKFIGFQFEPKDGPNLGSFALYTNSSEQTWWTTDGSNQTQLTGSGLTTSPQPFYSLDYNLGSSNYLNTVNTDLSVNALFSIVQNDGEKTLDLGDTTSSWPRKVATASITLDGQQSTQTYGVSLTFEDANGGTGTEFLLKDEANELGIPFSLFFDGEQITNLVAFDWTGIYADSTETKTISAKPANVSEAILFPSGTYSDTIWVTITANDTLVKL